MIESKNNITYPAPELPMSAVIVPGSKDADTPLSSRSLPGAVGGNSARPTDSDIVPDYIEREIDAECPCDAGWKNHGQYMKCVTDAAQWRVACDREYRQSGFGPYRGLYRA